MRRPLMRCRRPRQQGGYRLRNEYRHLGRKLMPVQRRSCLLVLLHSFRLLYDTVLHGW